MANAELNVVPRTIVGKKTAAMRRAGSMPANVYGHGIASLSVQAESVALTQLLRGMNKNQIIDLRVEGEEKPRSVIIRDVQRNPLNGALYHVDFFQVSMTEKMRAAVPVVLTGTSSAVDTYSGVLMQMVDVINVEALPSDIPSEFTVDVSVLTELESSIHVKDLSLDETKVHVMTDGDVVVARVASPRLAAVEEVAAGVPAEGAVAGAVTPAEGGGSE